MRRHGRQSARLTTVYWLYRLNVYVPLFPEFTLLGNAG
jgi:hypothetical protein